jgi:hypothetical protein
MLKFLNQNLTKIRAILPNDLLKSMPTLFIDSRIIIMLSNVIIYFLAKRFTNVLTLLLLL